MSLADEAATAGQRTVDDHADEWLSQGVAKAREAIAARTSALDQEQAERAAVNADPPRVRTLERAELRFASAGLDGVERHAPALIELGRDAARRLLVHVASGDEGSARRAGLAGGATFRARREASAASTAATAAATETRAKATEDALKLGRELGLELLHALPFLLAAL